MGHLQKLVCNSSFARKHQKLPKDRQKQQRRMCRVCPLFHRKIEADVQSLSVVFTERLPKAIEVDVQSLSAAFKRKTAKSNRGGCTKSGRYFAENTLCGAERISMGWFAYYLRGNKGRWGRKGWWGKYEKGDDDDDDDDNDDDDEREEWRRRLTGS